MKKSSKNFTIDLAAKTETLHSDSKLRNNYQKNDAETYVIKSNNPKVTQRQLSK